MPCACSLETVSLTALSRHTDMQCRLGTLHTWTRQERRQEALV